MNALTLKLVAALGWLMGASLGRGGHQDVSYLRLAGVGHCPHSLVRIEYLKPAVNDFFRRTLARPGTAK